MGTVAEMKDRRGNRTVKRASAVEKTDNITQLQKNLSVNSIYIQKIWRLPFIRSRYHKCVRAVYGNLTIT